MKPLRVLVAEDDVAVLATLVELCTALGHEVVAQARDGAEALEEVGRTRPDLLLLDIEMPMLTGLEVARQVIIDRELPFIIITGHAEEEFVTEAAHSGAFSYLIKPVSRERLAAAIALAMARFEEMKTLRGEVGDLKQTLEERKLIERAKGILMRDMNVKEQEAYSWLKRTSSHHNTRIAEIARRVVQLELNRK